LRSEISHEALFKTNQSESIEYLLIELKLKFVKLLLGVVYKPPNVSYMEFSVIESMMDGLVVNYDNCWRFECKFFEE
jgi:hypothetical protein